MFKNAHYVVWTRNVGGCKCHLSSASHPLICKISTFYYQTNLVNKFHQMFFVFLSWCTMSLTFSTMSTRHESAFQATIVVYLGRVVASFYTIVLTDYWLTYFLLLMKIAVCFTWDKVGVSSGTEEWPENMTEGKNINFWLKVGTSPP